jgi:hypothetical protein
VQSSHTEEKRKQAASYKRQLAQLEEDLARAKRDSHAKAKLEGLLRKNDEAVERLNAEIGRIRAQKASLSKQVSELQHTYDAFKKGKAKEITARARCAPLLQHHSLPALPPKCFAVAGLRWSEYLPASCASRCHAGQHAVLRVSVASRCRR